MTEGEISELARYVHQYKRGWAVVKVPDLAVVRCEMPCIDCDRPPNPLMLNDGIYLDEAKAAVDNMAEQIEKGRCDR